MKGGKLKEVIDMYQSRMNFASAIIREKVPRSPDVRFHIFAIGGYSLTQGALDHVERFSLE